MLNSPLSSFFGQQERRKGEELFQKNRVTISSASDTSISAFVKGSSPARVSLRAEQVASATIHCNCTCIKLRQGDLCKHIWAVLLKLQETGADFLVAKVQVLTPNVPVSSGEEPRSTKAEGYKLYQRQRIKDRNKEMRERKKRTERGPQLAYPAQVQESLNFFSANGCPLEELDLATLQNARKTLSRVFHPDKGGSHEEILDLNQHCDRLKAYLRL